MPVTRAEDPVVIVIEGDAEIRSRDLLIDLLQRKAGVKRCLARQIDRRTQPQGIALEHAKRRRNGRRLDRAGGRMRVFGIDGEAIDPDGNDDAPAIDGERRARNAPWDRIEIGAQPRRAIDLFARAERIVQRHRAAQLPGAE